MRLSCALGYAGQEEIQKEVAKLMDAINQTATHKASGEARFGKALWNLYSAEMEQQKERDDKEIRDLFDDDASMEEEDDNDSQEDEVNIVNPDDPDDNDRGEVPGEDDYSH
jgi:hypothetical protein